MKMQFNWHKETDNYQVYEAADSTHSYTVYVPKQNFSKDYITPKQPTFIFNSRKIPDSRVAELQREVERLKRINEILYQDKVTLVERIKKFINGLP